MTTCYPHSKFFKWNRICTRSGVLQETDPAIRLNGEGKGEKLAGPPPSSCGRWGFLLGGGKQSDCHLPCACRGVVSGEMLGIQNVGISFISCSLLSGDTWMGSAQTTGDLSENRGEKDSVAKRGAFCLSVCALRSKLIKNPIMWSLSRLKKQNSSLLDKVGGSRGRGRRLSRR